MNEEELMEERSSEKNEERSKVGSQKKRILIIGIVCLILALICLLLFLLNRCSKPAPKNSSGSNNGYVSPIDWETLHKENAEIYAWLEIPVSDEAVEAGHVIMPVDSVTGKGKAFVSLPVCQSSRDDEYYLDHNAEKKQDVNGALFSEHVYNKNDLTDPMTMIYGHRTEKMFGNLQAQFSTDTGFAACPEILIYLPDREMHFTVWAAVPYSSAHILYYNDFSKAREYMSFVRGIQGMRQIGSKVKSDEEISFGEPLIGLSTCLMGDRQQRFVVFGVCHQEQLKH